LVAVYDKGTKEASFQSRLLEILRNGKKVEAIKLYREEKGGGLQEGKIAVEEIIKKHGLPLPPVVPPRTC
jgi:ribosomal protein L7/L12